MLVTFKQETTGRAGKPQLNLHMNFNSKNQIWDDGDNVYQYDAAGNLFQDGTHGYVYDLENRITCVGVDINGNCTTTSTYYFYDAAGQRVGKQQANTLEDYVYDPEGHITSVYSNGSTSAFRAELYTPQGRHVSTWNPGANNGPLFYNFADWLGTERVRTDSSGIAREWCTDTPYGMNLTCTPSTDLSPMHFTGKERDYESNLDYFGARFNASNLGRFMTPDWSASPQGVPYADFSDPQTLNLYSYVRNNPLSHADADGHCAEDFCIGEALAVAAFAAYIASPAGQQTIRNGVEALASTPSLIRNLFASKSNNSPPPPSGSGQNSQTNSQSQSTPATPGGPNKDNKKTEHGEQRANEAREGDAHRDVGDANRVVQQGQQYTDSDTGNNVSVRGNRVVITNENGEEVSQFKNTRANTQQRVTSGRWVPKPKPGSK